MSARYFTYAHIAATAATTQVPGTSLPTSGNDAGMTLHAVTLNTPTSTAVLTIFDAGSAGACTAGNTVAVITCPASAFPTTLVYDVHISRGLFYTLATAAADVTISWA